MSGETITQLNNWTLLTDDIEMRNVPRHCATWRKLGLHVRLRGDGQQSHVAQRDGCYYHRWELVAADVMSPDRLHLSYRCERCGARGRQAWGSTRELMDRRAPYLFEKNLPGYERHFVISQRPILDTRFITLGQHPFLNGLRVSGRVWEDAPADQWILVVALVNDEGSEWAAYYQSPELPALDDDVADHGRKLPEEVARELFPEINQRYRR